MSTTAWPSWLSTVVARDAQTAARVQGPVHRPSVAGAPGELRLLILQAAERRLAIDIQDVAEVAKRPPLTRVPRTPGWHLGIAAIRGTLMPVVSLAEVLQFMPLIGADQAKGIDRVAPTPARVVVLRHASPIGLAVDEVTSVVRLEREQILSEGEGQAGAVGWAQGFAPLTRGLTAILATSRIEQALRAIPSVPMPVPR